MTFLHITKSGKSRAPKIYLYGREGIGKTTFIKSCPKPLIIDLEGGAERYSVDTAKVSAVWELRRVLLEVKDTNYSTVAIDTLEALERLIYAEICREAKVDSIEYAFGGRGRGYVVAGEKMDLILRTLSELVSLRKMAVILGQCEIKNVIAPEGEFSIYIPRANKKLSNCVMEWSDLMGFATYEHSEETGIGKRVIFTAPTKRAMAKSRLQLPEQINLSFDAIATALKKSNKKVEDGM